EMVRPEMFAKRYANVFASNERWNRIATTDAALYEWDEKSTYIQEPPFLTGLQPEGRTDCQSVPQGQIQPIRGARVLALLGDSVTTDHISPAGNISKD